ncbi:hydrolase 1, exosortase A system-associated [Polaromonas sp. C04]|uniref:hydrolase 1, exosortase A system-associated n=1 Tax=Polaromonas sp. C04 TaxID=1945857 RepID=UPI0009864B9F|nr:hydrolase 1, exosortase A system-associated [Polaromonas sp. C04]OOG51167.1 hydrolase 1, exosortase A system-associated [Polaromonas sp. C04]
MIYTEETALFACEGDTLLGILAKPERPAPTGVVVIVGGPQYRVGSHRQFVLLSRALAGAGYPVLRFDYRGMGDSTGAQHDFEAVSTDIATAIDALQQRVPAVRQVALWGLCDGASAALLYCDETHDPRVSSLCLLNPWVRSEASLARTQVKHYYRQRLIQKEFWTKLLHGKVALTALAGLARNIRVAITGTPSSDAIPSEQPYQHRMAAAWNAFNGNIFLLLSADDYTAKEFMEYASNEAAWRNALMHPRLLRHELKAADHTLSSEVARAKAEELTLNWLCDLRQRA